MNTTTRKARSLTAALITFGSLVGGANAAYTLTLFGTPGSTLINYEATGSTTLSISVPSFTQINTTFVASNNAPPANNGYQQINVPGDFLDDAIQSSSGNQNRPLSSPLTISLNGVEYATLETIEFVDFTGTLADGVYFETLSGPFDHPALVPGDTVTWSGSGTFNLNQGTFDALFTEGTYSSNSDFTLVIASIPEPSSSALLGLGGLSLAFRRSRR